VHIPESCNLARPKEETNKAQPSPVLELGVKYIDLRDRTIAAKLTRIGLGLGIKLIDLETESIAKLRIRNPHMSHKD